MRNYTKEELMNANPRDLYKMVLMGKTITRFPNGFWQRENSRENAIECIKYLIEEVLTYTSEDILINNSKTLFINHKLAGMLKICFNNSPYEAINSAYPNRFKEWEFKNVPKYYWNDIENGIKATKWLIEDKLKLSDKDIKKQISWKFFNEHGLGGMLQYCFNSSPYEAINSIYPDKFKEWEFNYVPNSYWKNKENGIKATRWLIEDKLNLSDTEIKEQLSYKFFKKHKLDSMIRICFEISPYKAINSIYPDRFKEWELKNIPKNYWKNKENGIKATRWLIEDKLKLSDEELKKQLSGRLFRSNGLRSMLRYCFDNNPYEAINNAYPNKFSKYDFKVYYK